MSQVEDSYYFAIYPKTLAVKGIYYNSKLPHFSIAIYKGGLRQDHTTLIPIRQQKLYVTLFNLQTGSLQFRQSRVLCQSGGLLSCEQRRVVVYELDQQLGDFTLRVDEYIANYQDYHSKHYQEKVKLTEQVDFDYQLYIANTPHELSQLITEHRGESQLKTPLTSYMNDDTPDKIISSLKGVQSEIYSPTLSVPKKQAGEDIDEQSSEKSSIPLSSPPVLNPSFAISLKAVPVKSSSSVGKQVWQSRTVWVQMRQFLDLPVREKVMFCGFALVSVATIYFSMLPVKKI